MSKILVVEDEQDVAAALTDILTSQHYVVEAATDGQVGLSLSEMFTYDLIVLDLSLPKLDGLSICRQLRAKGDSTPILLLTGYNDTANKVAGLDAGADDYVVKPFDIEELTARVRALLRRGGPGISPELEWGDLHLNPITFEATYQGQVLNLTVKESHLLELLLRNGRRVLSRNTILERVWPSDEAPQEETVKAHIKHLRQKLKAVGAPADFIETVYGLGYRLQ